MPGTWKQVTHCLIDHAVLTSYLPRIFCSAFCSDARIGELVHVTVNSVNNCPYCTGLHGELARMAGVEDSEKLMVAKTENEACALVKNRPEDLPYVKFARTFAQSNGFGIGPAFEDLATAVGAGPAKTTLALCWFLHWGSFGGNTLNNACKKPSLFGTIFFLYYFVLFGIITVVSKILKLFPSGGPKFFSGLVNATLPVVAGIWVVPLGILGAPLALTCGDSIRDKATLKCRTIMNPAAESPASAAEDNKGTRIP